MSFTKSNWREERKTESNRLTAALIRDVAMKGSFVAVQGDFQLIAGE